MNKVNALRIRQSLGAVLEELQRDDEPILIERGRVPVAVLISTKAFKERFVDYREKEKRDHIMNLARQSATKPRRDSLKAIRELRYGNY